MRVWCFFSHKSHNEEGASFFIYLLQKKQVLLKIKSPSLKTIRVLQRILWCFLFFFTFWNHQVYLRSGFLFYKSTEFLQRCWWHKMYWSKKLSLVFERTSLLSYYRFQSNARQDEGVIFYSQVSQWRSCEYFFFLVCFIFSFGEKKTGLAWTSIVLRWILTVY